VGVYKVSSPDEGYNSGRMPLAAHGVTHTGRRKTNEDSMLLDQSLGLFVVADGMGGHNAGEVASAIAVRTIHEYLQNAPAATEAALSEAFALANEEVFAAAAGSPEYEGMGTTLVAAVVQDERIVFGSVGDSRIYVWQNGTLTQLTRDDSWVSRVLPDEVSAEDVQRHPMRHVLTKVVGLHEDLEASVASAVLLRGDVLILCSDGLHGSLADARIAGTVTAESTVQDIAEQLVQQALTGGGTDNITVIVIRRE
jgi:PPM family protein phosphatase